MNKVARLSPDERQQLFTETSARRGLPAALIEKDFWVCWVLLQLFTIPELQGHVVFKGGTSLSKVFHAIQRFSEDIDLIIDYEMLGFVGAQHPIRASTRNKRTQLLQEMITSCNTYIEGKFHELLATRFAAVLQPGTWDLRARRTPDGSAVLEFLYPQSAAERVPYVQPIVLLEPGTNAEWVPKGQFEVRPFAAEEFPDLFDATAHVQAITAERTFWEKATILHAEHHRPENKRLIGRHSRHYYDLAMLAGTDIRANALKDAALRDRVVKHKAEFYYSAWARYDLAVPGTLKLLPPTSRLQELRRDYDAMSVMIFGDPPPLDEVLRSLTGLEREMNGR